MNAEIISSIILTMGGIFGFSLPVAAAYLCLFRPDYSRIVLTGSAALLPLTIIGIFLDAGITGATLAPGLVSAGGAAFLLLSAITWGVSILKRWAIGGLFVAGLFLCIISTHALLVGTAPTLTALLLCGFGLAYIAMTWATIVTSPQTLRGRWLPGWGFFLGSQPSVDSCSQLEAPTRENHG